jgi:predicted O-methyltransferase YrrM
MTSLSNLRDRASKRVKGALGRSGEPPVTAELNEWSVISSAIDLYERPTDAVLEILLAAAERAKTLHLDDVVERSAEEDGRYVNLWPGEHYRLLAALAHTRNVDLAIDIGTWRGQSALALAAGARRVISYDIIAWDQVPGTTSLRPGDFTSGKIEQRIGDLTDPTFLASQIDTLHEADLILVDGPKGGVDEDAFEYRFTREVLTQMTDRRRVIVYDDIRQMPMVQFWRDLPLAKLDATSLGHWSGTGIALTA